MATETKPRLSEKGVTYATDGKGPLFEREYRVVIADAKVSPEEMADRVKRRFPEFSPVHTAAFCRADRGADEPLGVGEDMKILVALKGGCQVRVVHEDDRSLTMRTLKGHPEAGRITFLADRDEDGNLVFTIRSRTRAGDWLSLVGYMMLGKQMQALTWTRFLGNVVKESGGRQVGSIKVSTRKVEEREADGADLDSPTIAPRGRS
jgi:hypothetical protein